jgi:hypothetical protein
MSACFASGAVNSIINFTQTAATSALTIMFPTNGIVGVTHRFCNNSLSAINNINYLPVATTGFGTDNSTFIGTVSSLGAGQQLTFTRLSYSFTSPNFSGVWSCK